MERREEKTPEREREFTDREVNELALQAGYILLENGAEIFRIEETMQRICESYGVTTWDSFVLSNGMFVTSEYHEGGSERTHFFAKVRQISVGKTNLAKVHAINQLSREIADGVVSLPEARERVLAIREMPGKRKCWRVLASAVGSAAFCYMLGGDLTDSAVAFGAGFILYLYILLCSEALHSKLVENLLGSALVTVICGICYRLGLGHSMNYMVVGSVIPLIPGVAFVTAIRDITNEDYISGFVRMLDALLVFFCIALGVAAGYTVLGFFGGGV